MRLLFALLLTAIAGFLFVPAGVPLRVFSDANVAKVPSDLLLAARFKRLENYAVRLAILDHVEPRGPGMPHLETLLAQLRGRFLFGKDKMAVFALERGYVGGGIYGWEDAMSQCFKTSAEELTLSDAATLMLHMQSPTAAWGNRRGDLLERRNAFLVGMAESGYVTDEVATAATMSPLVNCGN